MKKMLDIAEKETLSGYVKQQLEKKEQHVGNAIATVKPISPFLIFTYGMVSKRILDDIQNRILGLWPHLQSRVCIYCVETKNNVIEIRNYGSEELKSLTKEDIDDKIDELKAAKNGFVDFTKVKVYHMVNTTEIGTDEKYDRIQSEIGYINEMIPDKEQMQFYLLDERTRNQQNAKYFRNRMGRVKIDLQEEKNALVFLSNVMNNNMIIPEVEDNRGNLIAIFIALDNALKIVNNLSGKVLTAKYGEVVKSKEDLIYAVLHTLLDKIKGKIQEESGDKEWNALVDKMGISDEYGKFQIIQDNVESKDELKITQGLLDVFPIKNPEERLSIRSTYKEVNESSMGAVEAYIMLNIEQKIEQLRKESADGSIFDIQDKYRKKIRKKMTISDFYYLRNSMDDIRRILGKNTIPDFQDKPLESAVSIAKTYQYSKASNISEQLDVVLNGYVKAAKDIVEYVENELQKQNVYDNREDDLTQYYCGIVSNYIQQNRDIFGGLLQAQSLEDFKSGLRDFIKRLISGESVFAMSLEAVEEQHLKTDEAGALSYLKQKLNMEANNRQYLKVASPVSMPLSQLVIFNEGSQIRNQLEEPLGRLNYDCTDLGYSDSISAIQVFPVEDLIDLVIDN